MDSSTPRLFSHSAIRPFRDGFYGLFHTEGPNIVDYYHYHDYYEVTLYLGTDPVDYLYAGNRCTLRHGDIVFCNIFTPHVYLCHDNVGRSRFDFGLSPQLLSNLSLPGTGFQQLFGSTETAVPVVHCDFATLNRYRNFIMQYLDESENGGNAGVQEAILHLLLAHIYKDFGKDRIPDSGQTDKVYSIVRKLIEYIGTHLESRLSLKELAAMTNYSVPYISQLFKKATGETLTGYIIEKRITEAKQLIRQGTAPGEASRRVGFPNYSYFYRCFLRAEGVPPMEYQKKHF